MWQRFAVYVVPEGPLYDLGAAWLGWDSVAGAERPQPNLPGLAAEGLTATPRKYGFHGTLKPPFRLADGTTEADLRSALEAFGHRSRPVSLPAMEVRALNGFVAIVPAAPSEALADLAAAVVTDLDPFRALPTEAELTKRRAKGLTDNQEALLTAWGYPFVMDEFRFHLTLTGRLSEPDPVRRILGDYFAPALTGPLAIRSLALLGEAEDGRFHLLHRVPLSG